MNFGAMKDYKLKLRNLHASHALCCFSSTRLACIKMDIIFTTPFLFFLFFFSSKAGLRKKSHMSGGKASDKQPRDTVTADDDGQPAPRLTRSMANATVPLKLMSPGKQPEGKSKSEKGKTVAEQSKKARSTCHKFTIENMFGEILEPLLAFLAAAKPFAEVSRLAVVSKTWRRVSLNALKTAHQLNLSRFAESVTD